MLDARLALHQLTEEIVFLQYHYAMAGRYMKAIIISRVSTEEQKEAGNSLPAQTARLERYCQNKEFGIIKKFSFDESAYKDNRADFDKILDFVIEQKDKVAVCFDKVDRLSRNIFDIRVSTLYEKALRDEIELHFVSDGQIINSQISAVEKFQFGISLGLAKYYSDAISDNVKRVYEQKLRVGQWPHKAPFGYKNITLPDGKKDIIIDEYKSEIAKKIFEWYASGTYSLLLISRKLKNDFGIKIDKSYLALLLENPFYCGIMKWHEKPYPHKYQCLINQELFEKVKEVKLGHNKKKFKYAGLPFMYRGLFRCEYCGRSETPETHKGHVYYHCTQSNGKHGAKWIREEVITEEIGKFFKGIEVPGKYIEKILSSLKETHEGKMEFHNKQYAVLTARKTEITTSLDNLYMDKLKGRITDGVYDKFRTHLKEQEAEVDTKLSALQEAQDNYYITANYILELSKRAYKLFLGSEMEERRQLLKLVFSNLTIDDEKVRIVAQKPFDTIFNLANRLAWGG